MCAAVRFGTVEQVYYKWNHGPRCLPAEGPSHRLCLCGFLLTITTVLGKIVSFHIHVNCNVRAARLLPPSAAAPHLPCVTPPPTSLSWTRASACQTWFLCLCPRVDPQRLYSLPLEAPSPGRETSVRAAISSRSASTSCRYCSTCARRSSPPASAPPAAAVLLHPAVVRRGHGWPSSAGMYGTALSVSDVSHENLHPGHALLAPTHPLHASSPQRQAGWDELQPCSSMQLAHRCERISNWP